MNRPLTLVSLAIAALAIGLHAQEELEVVKFKARSPIVGDFQGAMTKSSNNSTMHMNRNGEDMPERNMTITSTTKRDATILEVKDGKVTKVKLHWREVLRENNMGEMGAGGRRGGRRGGADGEAPTPEITELAGQTLILDLSEATPTLKNEEGEAVDEGLTRLVTRTETRDGQFHGWSPDILAALGKSEFTVGEVVPMTRSVAEKIVGRQGRRGSARRGRRGQGGDEEGGEAEVNADADKGFSASLTFKGKRSVLGNDCGLFEIKLVDSRESADERSETSHKTTMTGELVLGVDSGWLYKLELKGKSTAEMNVSTEQGSFATNSDGELEMVQQVLYGKAKPAEEK